ncbi:MAG: hypothetical protein AAF968_01850, partial [Pseudomonadota bacterium]
MMLPRLLLACLLLGACSVAPRTPIAEAEISAAAPYGIPGALREWGGGIDEARLLAVRAEMATRARRIHAAAVEQGARPTETVLALSGGGADGAFGAGV